MASPRISPAGQGDHRYYKRALNFGFIWRLQHRPRRQLVERFLGEVRPGERDSILDLGAAALPEPLENVLECFYPWPERIVAAGTEDSSFLEARHPGLKFVRLQAGEPLPFADNAFDAAFCNAVIEHVGSRENQARFLAELVRVARNIFLATPNRWFPVELHTRLPLLHWLPPRLFRAALTHLGLDFYARQENLNLLTARELLGMLPGGGLQVSLRRHYFCGLPSNLVLVIRK